MTDIRKMLTFTNNNSLQLPNSFYKPPKQYVDCRELLRKRIEQQSSRRNIKELTQKDKLKFKKLTFLDETIKQNKANPSPDRYNDSYSSIKRYKSQSTFIPTPKKSDPTNKRLTWVQDIEKYESKNVKPTVGKYNLLSKSDFLIKRKSISLQKLSNKGSKLNTLDQVQFLASKVPGPGGYNPHKIIPKLKINPTSMKDLIKKHNQESKRKKKKLNESNLSSCSYSPVRDNTFESISKKGKRPTSLMKPIQIDKRNGARSQTTLPGPGSYNILNKWGKQTFSKQKLIGQLNIFSRTTGSFQSSKIYH